MKIYNNIRLLGLIIILITTLFSANSCKDEDNASAPISIVNVYLEDLNSPVQDRLVTFARLGQTIRLEGSGFTGLKKIYINGYDTYFNPVFVTDNNVIFSISGKTPTMEANADERNTIRLVKDASSFMQTFTIKAALPEITSISHTLPAAGDSITIYGSGLTEISQIVFPGDVVVSSNIISDEKGTYCKVAVPAGLTEQGSIYVEGSNGGVYSPAYFNCNKCVILNFDGVGHHSSWGSTDGMITDSDLESGVVTGYPVASQGLYCAHRPSRIASFGASKNRCSEVWTSGSDATDNWRTYLTPYIPANTPVSDFAFQFDIYVPEVWNNTGFLKITIANDMNGGEWSKTCYNYVPWIVNGIQVPFKTQGWTTVTIPFSMFYAFSSTTTKYTFEDVIAYREAASNKNFGIMFENSDIKLSDITGKDTDATIFPSSVTSINVYTDNWRVVPLKPEKTYSDF